MKEINKCRFHGVGMYPNGFTVYCSMLDSEDKHIENSNIEDENNLGKGFIFERKGIGAKIVEIRHYGQWEEYEFLGSPHSGWVPLKFEEILDNPDEQKKAFKTFKDLIKKAEEINGYSLLDPRNEIFSDDRFHEILTKVLTSKIYLDA
jgi:hypothetical protein